METPEQVLVVPRSLLFSGGEIPQGLIRDGLDDLVLGVATPMSDPADGAVDIRLNRTGLTTPGDIDGDGDVDTADLLTLLSAWGVCPPPPAGCPGDLDGNGIVGTADLLTLLANFG